MRFICVLYCVVGLTLALPEEPKNTFDKLYIWGKDAYDNERWNDCVAFMKKSLEDFQYHQDGLIFCRRKCKEIVPEFGKERLDELVIFDRFIKKSLCLEKCKKEHFGDRPNVDIDEDIAREFERVQPYSYMQLCYWKQNDLELAVSSAYTYLIKNPNHKLMIENLGFFMEQPEYDAELMLIDRLEKQYQLLYMEATELYDQNDYIGAVSKFLLSLSDFFDELENCRLLCESSLDYRMLDGAPEMYTLVADVYKTVLQCKTGCEKRLATLKGNYMADFVPSYYDHLQFSYYKMRNVGKAAEAVASYLLFLPEAETMLNNKQFYKITYALDESDFIPNKKLLLYYEREVLEKRQLDFLNEKFKIIDGVYETEHSDDYGELDSDIIHASRYLEHYENLEHQKGKLQPPPIVEKRQRDADMDSQSKTGSKEQTVDWKPPEELLKKFESQKGVRVVRKEEELNGSFRFFAENVLSQAECDSLMKLQDFTESGHGYEGDVSPLNQYEYFNGLSIARISELATLHQLPIETAKLVFDKSELARDFTRAYFNLSSLYFDYTHFVCREPKQDVQLDRSDYLSHPIHGDNCIINEDQCVKEKPAFIWRDYSIVIYLNDHFEGGEFVFSDIDENIQAEIKPGCGQMVGFTGETLHGVKAVTKGTRCVIAAWMTLDSRHEEKERVEAQQKLAELEILEHTDQNQVDNQKSD